MQYSWGVCPYMYKSLNKDQRKLVKEFEENLQPLPQTFNCSKGSKCSTSGQPWEKYKGDPLHPDYVKYNNQLQRDKKQELESYIEEISQE